MSADGIYDGGGDEISLEEDWRLLMSRPLDAHIMNKMRVETPAGYANLNVIGTMS